MKKFALLAALLLAACTQPENTTRILSEQGYTDIQITGYEAFACAEDDDTCTGFNATAPGGGRVHGAVGAGYLFKGATVRIL